MVGPNRRRFLYMLGGAAAGITTATSWQMLAGRQGNNVVQRTSHALGAQVSLTVVHPDQAVAERAISAAFRELDLVEDVLSLYRPHSQLCELNRTGRLAGPHPFLLEVLEAAHAMSQASNGAFDITVQPLWQALAAAKSKQQELSDEQLAALRQNVDWRRLQIGDDEIRFTAPGMAATLNGIAQGFATDRVAKVLAEHGIQHALIDAGEFRACGERSAGGPWRVGVQHPRQADAYIAITALANRCLATSGDYATRFDDARGTHHIFDPQTGRSPTHFCSVSVVAPTAMQADALSTALFVMPPDAGLRLVEQTPGVDVLLVLTNGQTVRTAGFPS